MSTRGLALPIIRYKGFLVYANLNEEDGTVACWPCAMDRAPLLSVPPVTLAIFSEVPLKEFEASYQKVLYEDALERGKRRHEKNFTSMKKNAAPKLDEAFLLSVTEYDHDDDEAFHEDGGNEEDIPPGIDIETTTPEKIYGMEKKNSIQSISSLPGSPMVRESKPPGLTLKKSKSPPLPPPPSLHPTISKNEDPMNKDVFKPTHKISSSLSRDIIVSSSIAKSQVSPTTKTKRSENEDNNNNLQSVWAPVLEKMRDRLSALEEQEKNHGIKSQEILKRLQVQEAGSRLPEKTNPMIVKIKQLSNRMMRMESKMQSNASSSVYDEEEAKQRVLDVENALHGEMRVVARRLRLFEQRRSEDHEMLESIVLPNL